jgi:transcriptional regulator with XRE-family HTH domain
MDITKIFSNQVKKFRQEINLSQEKLALKAGLDRTYIASIENKKRNVSIKTARQIANALNVDICTLLNEKNK